MSIHLLELIFFSYLKFYQKARKLRRNENCNKTANNANNNIFLSTTTLIPLWYQEINPF